MNSTTVSATWPSASPTRAPLPVPFAHAVGAIVTISGAWTNSYIGLQVAVIPGLFLHLRDENGGYVETSISTASGNCSHVAPPNWFYAPGNDAQVKLFAHDGTGSGIPQADTRIVLVTVKS